MVCSIASSPDGYESQQTNEPDDPMRSHNLWQTVPGERGAHGRFDAHARSHSLRVWATRHRRELAALGAAVVGAISFYETFFQNSKSA